MKLYDEAAVREALNFPALIAALENMLLEGAAAPPRHVHQIPVPNEADASLLLMPAWQVGGLIGVKLVTFFPGNTARGLSTVAATYALFDGRNGQPLGILDGEELTARRTAAASAVAAKRLARKDAASLLIIGTGKLAGYFAEAHASIRPLNAIAIWGRDAAKAEKLAADLRQRGLPAVASADIEAASRQADMISCVTSSTTPLVKGAWVKAGAHLDLVGGFRADMRESDDEAVRRASVFVDTRAGALLAGDLAQPLRDGIISAASIRADLHELVSGAHPGRRDAGEITLFKSVGFALEDLAAARFVSASR